MGEYKPILLNPNNENKEFKCDICDKFLSISPILFNKSVGNVCGRCFEDGETTKFDPSIVFQVQKVYENVANYIIFPCSYHINGCTKELKWSEVQDHEKLCDLRDVNCPLSCKEFTENDLNILKACEWKGTNQDLVSHLRSSHDNYISNTAQLKIHASHEDCTKLLFTEVKGTFTIIVMYYLKNIGLYYCNVLMDFPFNDCKTYQYDIDVLDETEKRCLILPGNNIEPISGRNLAKKSIKTSFEIDLKSINSILRKPTSLIVRFRINRMYEDKSEPLDNDENRETGQEESIIPYLKCSCGNFLFSPIYICNNGHNCCVNCKSSFGYCKNCSQGFMSYKNTALETVAVLTKYPCTNKSKGCTHLMNFKELALHEENCSFTEKSCHLQCGYRGINNDLFKHIRERHSHLKLHEEYVYDTSSKSKCYPILFDNKVFILTFEYIMQYPLYIKMQCLGMDKWKYEFEFTILSSCNNIHFVSNHLCQPLSYGVDKKELPTQKIVYPFEFFTQFTTDYDQIKFKINITRIQN